MKAKRVILIILACTVSLLTCETNPLTGQSTMAFVSDSELFAASFQQYQEFLDESTVIGVNDPDPVKRANAQMVERLGTNIKIAAEKWYASIGKPYYLKDYRWEYKLVDDEQVNAWCMPGGKIVVYTGILPVTKIYDDDESIGYNEDALAVVMGHEVSHALLNHGKQRLSASYLQQIGLMGVGLAAGLAGADETTQNLFMVAAGLGSNLGVMLPFSRENESEADHYGLDLMAIAGYDPEASVPFWERMAEMSGGTLEFLSTHPSSDNRAKELRKLIPEAQRKAAKLHLDNVKDAIPRAKLTAAEINKQ